MGEGEARRTLSSAFIRKSRLRASVDANVSWGTGGVVSVDLVGRWTRETSSTERENDFFLVDDVSCEFCDI